MIWQSFFCDRNRILRGPSRSYSNYSLLKMQSNKPLMWDDGSVRNFHADFKSQHSSLPGRAGQKIAVNVRGCKSVGFWEDGGSVEPSYTNETVEVEIAMHGQRSKSATIKELIGADSMDDTAKEMTWEALQEVAEQVAQSTKTLAAKAKVNIEVAGLLAQLKPREVFEYYSDDDHGYEEVTMEDEEETGERFLARHFGKADGDTGRRSAQLCGPDSCKAQLCDPKYAAKGTNVR
jgi:hypothetical protein